MFRVVNAASGRALGEFEPEDAAEAAQAQTCATGVSASPFPVEGS